MLIRVMAAQMNVSTGVDTPHSSSIGPTDSYYFSGLHEDMPFGTALYVSSSSLIDFRMLDEQRRQAYQAIFRSRPCQPSMVSWYLRTPEGVSPPRALSHRTQMMANAYIATSRWVPLPHLVHFF
jgi:hypothetical protein